MAHMLDNTGAGNARFTAKEQADLVAAGAAIQIRGLLLQDSDPAFSEVEAA